VSPLKVWHMRALDKWHAGPVFAKAGTAGPFQGYRVMLCNLDATHYADTVLGLAHNYQILRMPFAISRLYTFLDSAEHHICVRL